MTKPVNITTTDPADSSKTIVIQPVTIEVSPIDIAPRSSTIKALTWVEWAAKLCSDLNRKSRTHRWKIFSTSEGLVYIGRFRISNT